jgi:hypothetical protein
MTVDEPITVRAVRKAMRRVQALAADVLRQRGVKPPKPKMPDPVPGSGELFPAAAVPARAGRPEPLPPDEAMRAAVAAAAHRADQTRAVQGPRITGTPVRAVASRDALRDRLAGDRS